MKKMRTIIIILSVVVGGVSFAQDLGFVEYAGCQEEDYVFVDREEVEVVASGMGYSPKCLIVRPGTLVTISASGFHPLSAAAGFGGVENPFFSEDNFEFFRPQTRELVDVGFYGYFCSSHVRNPVTGEGMAGVIQVRESLLELE